MSGRRARQAQQPQRDAAAGPARRRRWRRIGGLAVGAALVAALVFGLVVARRNGSAAPTPAAAGGTDRPAAPDLRGTDPITGGEVSLASFRGRTVVLNVWASWCTGCRAEARDLGRFARDHPEVQVVGIDTQDSNSAARSFYSLFGWTHPSIADPNGSMAARLALQGLPSTFFIDANGRIVSRIVGASNYSGFAAGLRAAKKI